MEARVFNLARGIYFSIGKGNSCLQITDEEERMMISKERDGWNINYYTHKPATPLLDTINYHPHIINLSSHDLEQLTTELRPHIVQTVSKIGEFNVLVGDWYTKSHTTLKKLLHSGRSLGKPNGVLINGKNAKGDGKDEVVYTMKAGKTYKYRIYNDLTLFQNNYDSLDIHVGQWFTVLVTANKEPKDYYVVAATRFYKSTVTGKVVIRYKNGKTPTLLELPEAPVGWACSLNHFHTFRWNLTASVARPNPQGSYKYGSIPINMPIKLQLDGLAGKLH
ncbi:L-ascorbate oxidase-like protein [Senna tora]|uniref:L-ascorbate oxidase-like protein n=1 Tax=Senna tora TaxID=362788 RepID=A0A834T1Z1_9FABA|nr:L-ascorbate oxidase-like protein [Senna tora]